MRRHGEAWGVACGIFLTLFFGSVRCASATTSPASLIVKVFEMRVSTSSDCTGSMTVFKTAFPTPVDLVQNPTLGSGAINDGTFHCLMYHVSDFVSVTPAADDLPGCLASTQYNDLDFFTSADISVTPPPGTSIQGHTSMEDDPWIYFSDALVASPNNNGFQPTSDCSCGAAPARTAPLTLISDQTHTLVMNFTNQLDGSGGTCVLIPAAIGSTPVPAFSLR